MKVVLAKTEDVTSSIKTLWFVPEYSVHYQAGEFIELTVPGDNPDDRGIKRWFTLSSSPTEELVAVTTRFSENGSTFKQALLDLRPGDQIHMSDPMGDFVLPRNKDRSILYVAGGIGVTPARSMVQWMSDTSDNRDFTLLHSAHSPEELAFDGHFKNADIAYVPIVKKAPQHWQGEVGHITIELIQKLIKNENTLIYLAGPENMVESLQKDLEQTGYPRKNIAVDFFHGY